MKEGSPKSFKFGHVHYSYKERLYKIFYCVNVRRKGKKREIDVHIDWIDRILEM